MPEVKEWARNGLYRMFVWDLFRTVQRSYKLKIRIILEKLKISRINFAKKCVLLFLKFIVLNVFFLICVPFRASISQKKQSTPKSGPSRSKHADGF